MAEDISEDAIDFHNEMVFDLGEGITQEQLFKLKCLFDGNPLSQNDINQIKTIQELFIRLRIEKIISVGDYKKFVPKLKLVNRDLCSIVDTCTNKIKSLRREEDIEEMVISMDKTKYHASEGLTAYIGCTVDPKADSITWKKGKERPLLSTRIPIDNRKYFSGYPKAPTLVIKKSSKSKDEAHYQCSAKAKSKAVDGEIVHLEVSDEGKSNATTTGSTKYYNSPSKSGLSTAVGHEVSQQENDSDNDNESYRRKSLPNLSSSAEGSKADLNNSSISSTGRKRSLSYPTTEMHTQNIGKRDNHADQGCHVSLVIRNEIDIRREASVDDISKGISAVTEENGRVKNVTFEKKCILVRVFITAPRTVSEPSSVHLAEKIRHYILDGGRLRLSDESRTILDIDKDSFKITPTNACQNGLPYVNVSHGMFTVPVGESAILQTYIIAKEVATSIRWFKLKSDQQSAIEIDNKKYFGGSDLSPTLIIRNANIDDQGKYLCWATNKRGTGSSNISFVSIQNGRISGTKRKRTTMTSCHSNQPAVMHGTKPKMICLESEATSGEMPHSTDFTFTTLPEQNFEPITLVKKRHIETVRSPSDITDSGDDYGQQSSSKSSSRARGSPPLKNADPTAEMHSQYIGTQAVALEIPTALGKQRRIRSERSPSDITAVMHETKQKKIRLESEAKSGDMPHSTDFTFTTLPEQNFEPLTLVKIRHIGNVRSPTYITDYSTNMAKDISADAISIQNEMVHCLDESITPVQLSKLKFLFNGFPLSANDMNEIKSIQELFYRLQIEKCISVGDYTKFVPNLEIVNRDLCSIVDTYTRKIKSLRRGEDIVSSLVEAKTDKTRSAVFDTTGGMVKSMDNAEYLAIEGSTAYLNCTVDPTPDSITWNKGHEGPLCIRIPNDNRKYFSGWPKAPTLVINQATKAIDEAHYQCIAKANSTVVDGKIVRLEVCKNDTGDDYGQPLSSKSSSSARGSPLLKNTDPTAEMHSIYIGTQAVPLEMSIALGKQRRIQTERSPSDITENLTAECVEETASKSPDDAAENVPRKCDEETASKSFSDVEDFGISNDQGCQASFVIKNKTDPKRPELVSDISNGFAVATNAKERVNDITFKPQCILVCIDITPARSPEKPSSVHLAKQFWYYILDGGRIQLSDESRTILDIDEATFEITPHNARQDGRPYVNISHGMFTVPVGGSAIVQTYLIALPVATSIRWFKIKSNQQMAIEIDNEKYFGGSDLSPTLIIRNATIDDQGLYLCLATNKFGTGSSSTSFISIQSAVTLETPKIIRLESKTGEEPLSKDSIFKTLPKQDFDSKPLAKKGRIKTKGSPSDITAILPAEHNLEEASKCLSDVEEIDALNMPPKLPPRAPATLKI